MKKENPLKDFDTWLESLEEDELQDEPLSKWFWVGIALILISLIVTIIYI